MITPSFGITATERVLPKLALDFTTASLDPRVTFTRSGNTATVTNSSGVIAAINADLPRFDFNPTTLACKGLLIEESRTNTIINNTMVGAVAGTPGTNPNSWGYLVAGTGLTKTIVGVGTESGINYIDVSISGTAVSTAAIAAAFAELIIVASNGETWTSSVYLRLIAGSLSNVQLQLGILEFTAVGGFVSGANYNITSPTNAALITQRFSATRTLVGGATVARVQPTINSSCSIGASIDFTLRIGLPQMELGAFPTSVILTSSATVTRNADIASMTGTNFSNWYNASEGAFVASAVIARQAAIIQTTIFSANDNTVVNYINCFYRSAGSLGSIVVAGSVSQFDQTPLGVTAANTVVNVGVAYKLNDAVSYANGTVQATDTILTVPTITQLQFGISPTGAYLNGYVRNLRYWKQRILNAEGQAFSK